MGLRTKGTTGRLSAALATNENKLDYIMDTVITEPMNGRRVSHTHTHKLRAGYLNAVYFRRGLTCTLGLTNDLIDGGQPRAKPHLHKAKPNHVLETFFSPRLATVYQVVG